MGKTVRNYDGDGLKTMKKIAPKKKNSRSRDFIDDDEDFYESYHSDSDDQSDND